MWDNIRRIDDDQEHVTKFVYERSDAVAESVLYRYPTYAQRTVICISTQSGCPVGCRFCGAGDAFVRSLGADEIVHQAVYSVEQACAAEQITPKDIGRLQIMFMSMGEPLLNLKNLEPALNILHQLYPKAALLISTIGPKLGHLDYARLIELAARIPTIGLQFSVHEAFDEERNKLIPFKAKLKLDDIAFYGHLFKMRTGRPAFFNYCAHDGNNDDVDADELRRLFDPEDFCATVSVICERNEGLPATNDHQRELAVDFAAKLVERGFDVRVFDPAGQDTIGGGCGQLWFVQSWMKEHAELTRPSIGAGKPEVHVPFDPRDVSVFDNFTGAPMALGGYVAVDQTLPVILNGCAYPADGGLKAQARPIEETLSIGDVLRKEFVDDGGWLEVAWRN